MSDITVKAFKMVSGEEIVARVVSENDDSFLVSKPLVLMATPHESGQMQIGMIPWMMTAQEGDLELAKQSIAATTTPAKQFEDGYLQQTTNIALGA